MNEATYVTHCRVLIFRNDPKKNNSLFQATGGFVPRKDDRLTFNNLHLLRIPINGFFLFGTCITKQCGCSRP